MNLITEIVLALLFMKYFGTSTDPTMIPKNNSHYIEGLSQYIWWEDDKGKLKLIDLWNSAKESDKKKGKLGQMHTYDHCVFRFSKYEVFGYNYTIFEYGNEEKVKKGYYDPKKNLYVIIHDWMGRWNDAPCESIRRSFIQSGDNIIDLDWTYLSGREEYAPTANNLQVPGIELGRFIQWLLKVGGGSYDKLHIIGVGMGAHVAGIAGRTLGGKAQRITGLDPAGPLFDFNTNSIKPTDGRYVEIIHTDAGAMGLKRPAGHADFYPNGGKALQPGCKPQEFGCSHKRAAHLFVATIKSAKEILIGRECKYLLDAISNECGGQRLPLGNIKWDKKGIGLYALATTDQHPYDAAK